MFTNELDGVPSFIQLELIINESPVPTEERKKSYDSFCLTKRLDMDIISIFLISP